MALLQRIAYSVFSIMIILALFLLPSSSSSRVGGSFLDHIGEETGYDFRAYPFYFGPIDGSDKFFNNFTNILTRSNKLERSVRIINVDTFGAKGDGSTDDSQAFQKAWKAACSSGVAVNFVVSKGKNYLLKPITFFGPCKSGITWQTYGTIEASDTMSDYSKDMRHWILFNGVQNLAVEGGIVNGNGQIWWQNSCKIKKSPKCNKHAPTALTFYNCRNLRVEDMYIQDSQQIHLSFEKCINVIATNLHVTAPEKSPNTDGIHVTDSQNVQISSSSIGTGDDCISIVSGSKKIQATDITCGPGHGISIGSLGAGNSEAHVSDITINGAKISGTSNGVRIKTWQGGSGSASNIKFHNINMDNVENPIIIDQNYCDQDEPCGKQKSAVQVKNVLYQNIKGTSASDIAINFDCSESFPCQGIVLQNIELVKEGGSSAKAQCSNIRWTNAGSVSPLCPKSN